MPTDNHTQDPALAEIKRAELLQGFEISHELTRKALAKTRITVSDVEIAAGHGRDMMKKLDDLRLALFGIETK